MKNVIVNILADAIKRQDPYLDQPVDLSHGADAILYVEGGQLDSLSLVTIITDVEQKILDMFGRKIQLATERDLSMNDSPFKTFGNMVAFIEGRIGDISLGGGNTA